LQTLGWSVTHVKYEVINAYADSSPGSNVA